MTDIYLQLYNFFARMADYIRFFSPSPPPLPVFPARSFNTCLLAASEMKMPIFIVTWFGSIGDNGSGGVYAYCCSYAALNMAVKSISIEFADHGILAAVLHPGSVATDARTGGNDIPVSKSVTGVRGVIGGITPDMTGTSH